MRIFLGLLLCCLVLGCQFGLTEHGNLGQTCFGDGTCDHGLACVQGICRKPQEAPDAGADAGKPDSGGRDAGLSDEVSDAGVADAGDAVIVRQWHHQGWFGSGSVGSNGERNGFGVLSPLRRAYKK